MKILLDTHIFLWFISGDDRLPAEVKIALLNTRNQIYLSPVSLWEAIIKYESGKLPLPEPPSTYLPALRVKHDISSLPIDEDSAARVSALPSHHRDPFDRMLVAQALYHNMYLATVDAIVRSYPVKLL